MFTIYCYQLLEEAELSLADVRLIYTPPKFPLTNSDFLSTDAWIDVGPSSQPS